MKLNPNQLPQHLNADLDRGYWVASDETLLTIEACDQIRAAALKQGFNNRRVCHIDSHTDWQEILADANSLSLFADKNLLELRFSTGKPNANTIAQLNAYFEQANPDTVVLISSPKLDNHFVKTKGYKTLQTKLQTLSLWPIGTDELPRWISGRLQTQGYSIDPDALQLLCGSVEGNLLAAQQQLMQLSLASDDKHISLAILQRTVANDARYNHFETIDKALNGATGDSLKAIAGLRSAGLEPARISWIIAREIQTLISIRQNAKTLGANGAIQQARIWKREAIIRNALKRLKMRDLERCLQQAHQLDAMAKGQIAGDPWDAMATLLMSIGGIKTPKP